MEYEKTDEVARRQAYQRVQQIADAIIKIRKKYFLCFSKISDIDQKRYEELKVQMKNIAEENGLQKFNAQLISDIDIQFGEDMPNYTDENGKLSNGAIEDLYQKFLNVLAMQAELTIFANEKLDTDPELANAYLKKAGMCQSRAKEYERYLISVYNKNRLDCDRRAVFEGKFGEQTKDSVLKFCETTGYIETTSKDPLMLKDIINNINECRNYEANQKRETEILQ